MLGYVPEWWVYGGAGPFSCTPGFFSEEKCIISGFVTGRDPRGSTVPEKRLPWSSRRLSVINNDSVLLGATQQLLPVVWKVLEGGREKTRSTISITPFFWRAKFRGLLTAKRGSLVCSNREGEHKVGAYFRVDVALRQTAASRDTVSKGNVGYIPSQQVCSSLINVFALGDRNYE